jgi:hypothetical protein
VSEPNWTESKTGDCEIWKNPLIPMNDRLEIADGAIRFRDEQLDRLRAENAAQALLIASLKETEGAYYRLLELESSDVMLDTLNHIDTLTQQLSDTQRQNAELMQRISEAEKDAEQDREWVCAAEVRLLEISGQLPGQHVMHQIESLRKRASEKKLEMLRRDSAIAASKVSNEGDENE